MSLLAVLAEIEPESDFQQIHDNYGLELVNYPEYCLWRIFHLQDNSLKLEWESSPTYQQAIENAILYLENFLNKANNSL